ncbi:1101_t:CDS:1, partial [Dentiscutata erythropus]
MRNTHEIRNYLHANSLNTRLICDICEANYPTNTNLTNLKNYYAKYHKQEYHLAISKNEERRKQIKQVNQLQ